MLSAFSATETKASSTFTASVGHTVTHAIHQIQSDSRTGAALSVRSSFYSVPLKPIFLVHSKTPTGHAGRHAPSATQSSKSTAT